MALRYIDTNLFKKSFFMDLPLEYQFFWIFLFTDCDHAGIWSKNSTIFNAIAKVSIDLNRAFEYFNTDKIRVVEVNKNKWFLPGFIEIQYKNSLNPKNPAHRSVISILQRYGLLDEEYRIINNLEAPGKGLDSPCQGEKDKDKDKDKDILVLPEEERDTTIVSNPESIFVEETGILVSNKKRFRELLKILKTKNIEIGDFANRVKIYYETCKQSKWKHYVFTESFGKVCENLNIFLTIDSLNERLGKMATWNENENKGKKITRGA